MLIYGICVVVKNNRSSAILFCSQDVDLEAVKSQISGFADAPLILLEGYPKNKSDIEAFNQQVGIVVEAGCHTEGYPKNKSEIEAFNQQVGIVVEAGYYTEGDPKNKSEIEAFNQ